MPLRPLWQQAVLRRIASRRGVRSDRPPMTVRARRLADAHRSSMIAALRAADQVQPLADSFDRYLSLTPRGKTVRSARNLSLPNR